MWGKRHQRCGHCDRDHQLSWRAVHDKLLLKSDHHVAYEDDAKRLNFHNTVAQRAWSRIDDIVVSVISDNIDLPVLTTDRNLPESGRIVRQLLPRALPVEITPPAIIDGISRATHPKHSSRIILLLLCKTLLKIDVTQLWPTQGASQCIPWRAEPRKHSTSLHEEHTKSPLRNYYTPYLFLCTSLEIENCRIKSKK
jgi:hypothetical protein